MKLFLKIFRQSMHTLIVTLIPVESTVGELFDGRVSLSAAKKTLIYGGVRFLQSGRLKSIKVSATPGEPFEIQVPTI